LSKGGKAERGPLANTQKKLINAGEAGCGWL